MLESDLVLVLAASAPLYPVDEFYPVDEGNEDASPTSLESLVAVESSSFTPDNTDMNASFQGSKDSSECAFHRVNASMTNGDGWRCGIICLNPNGHLRYYCLTVTN